MAVSAVDHLDLGGHSAREREQRHTGREREGRVGVAEVVDPPLRLDPCGADRRLQVARAEVVEVAFALTALAVSGLLGAQTLAARSRARVSGMTLSKDAARFARPRRCPTLLFERARTAL